jgi:hypothetical protein
MVNGPTEEMDWPHPASKVLLPCRAPLTLSNVRPGGKMVNYLEMIWKRLRLTLEMIKFEHSVFALPFALTGRFTG